jgi:ADP-ribose pyrophosphatase YjhB (NUDIX family)
MFTVIKIKLLLKLVGIASKVFGVSVPPIPSVSAIIVRADKILVVKLTYKKGYALPGGVLKGNEDFVSAMKREVKEETGLEVADYRYFNTFGLTENYPKVVLYYLANVRGKLRGSEEGEPEWKSIKNIEKKLVYKDNIKAMKMYQNYKAKKAGEK